nr:response regulator transcription factor [Microbacterium testaceum]
MTATDAIRVLIADDNRPFRRGVRLRLENAADITVVGEAATGGDAVARAVAERADIVLMDLEMPGMNGFDATRAIIRETHGATRILVLTSHGEQNLVLRALAEGASGYLLKTHDSAQLVDALRAAHAGAALVSTRVAAPVIRELAHLRVSDDDRARVRSLSPSETRVVALLSQGITSNEALAGELTVSVNTVRSHVQSALRKVDVADRTQLALWGARMRAHLPAPGEGPISSAPPGP